MLLAPRRLEDARREDLLFDLACIAKMHWLPMLLGALAVLMLRAIKALFAPWLSS